MNRVPAVVAAFTLIEMMISIALGMMIVFVATSGFRTASQTVTAANRLALENSLLRSGYFEAQNQLDFWTNLDDPNAADADRPMKTPSLSIGNITDWTGQGRRHGMPFTAMSDLAATATSTTDARKIWPAGGATGTNPRFAPTTLPAQPGDPQSRLGNFVMPRPGTTYSDLGWEADKGWDPSYYWSPSDPRTWCRANLAEKDRANGGRGNDQPNNLPLIIYGRYAIFGNTVPTAQDLTKFTIKPDLNDANKAQAASVQEMSYSGYAGTGIHTWYYMQLDGLVNAMGYAAFCDYLPANAIYTWYSDHGDRTVGGINKFGVSPDYNFTNGDGNQRNSRGIYRNTYSASFGYINPRSWNDWGVDPAPATGTAMTGDTLRQKFYQHYNSDYGATDTGGAVELRWFLRHVNMPESLLTAKPLNWPEINVSVGRLIKNAHFVAVAKVRRFSALTGETIELSWCGLGSTLRGARQQRNRSTGWAKWDNAGSATIDPNLDTP